jgi:hypothetical protein
MPDISMCSNADCPSRTICWRFMAKPDAFQRYGVFKTDGDKCGSFWPMDGVNYPAASDRASCFNDA